MREFADSSVSGQSVLTESAGDSSVMATTSKDLPGASTDRYMDIQEIDEYKWQGKSNNMMA